MNRHIEEHPAGIFRVLGGRRFRIARGNPQDLKLAQRAGSRQLADPVEVMIKTAVKADLELDPGFFGSGFRLEDAFDFQVDRLFAEDMLPGVGGFDRNLSMCIRRGTDENIREAKPSSSRGN